jgi:two-component system sensor histidine kinase BaeS
VTIKRKLLIAFLSIALLTSLVMAVLWSLTTRSLFDWYVRSNIEARTMQWQGLLTAYYIEKGSWDGVNALIKASQPTGGRGSPRRLIMSSITAEPDRIILEDETNKIIADSDVIGIRIAPTNKTNLFKLPITVNGRVVGSVSVVSAFQRGLATLEAAFLSRMSATSMIGGSIVALIGIILAFAFSRHLSRPLCGLAAAARQIALGDFNVSLRVSTGDEIGDVADAFNYMKDSLKANEEARHKLVADVAHELRTPLSVLRGNFESIQDGITELSQEIIVSLHDEVIRLSRIVQDLLNLGQMESGAFPLSLETTDLREVIEKATSVFTSETETRGISLEINIQEASPKIQADPDRITQVLINLLANAVHHTPDNGEISVSLSASENSVNISIKDSGPGIPKKDLPYIFDRFYRTDRARHRAAGGTGLGLAIAKGIINAHKGSIQVKSGEGPGTVFIINLPISHNSKS